VKELEEKELHHSNENWFLERSRLVYIIDGKNQEIEKMKREMETQRSHIDSIRREVILLILTGLSIHTFFSSRVSLIGQWITKLICCQFQNDELKRKLKDFDKVTKVKRSLTLDTVEHDPEIRELKNKYELNKFT